MSGPDRIWIEHHEAVAIGGSPEWLCVRAMTNPNRPMDVEYVRRDPAVLAALPEVQAIVDAAVKAALDDVTTLHTVIADIRAATVGSKPMLSELAAALVEWRDEAVRAEREACVAECKHRASTREGIGDFHLMREAERCAAAIRKRGEG